MRFLFFFLLTALCEAFTLRVDFNDSTGRTQAGWESIYATDSVGGDTWRKTFAGGIALDVDAIGNVVLDTRDRTGNGGGGEADMWRDFLFANGSFASRPGSGLRLQFTGLAANTEYPIKIWEHDSGSGFRAADWSGGGSGTIRITPGSTPATLADNVHNLSVTTDSTGAVTLTGIVSATFPASGHNVFINGLEIGNPITPDPPTDIVLSASPVANTAPIGTLVSTLSSIDPSISDSHLYALVSGDGDTDNAQFEINGDTLRTIRDLSIFPGGTNLQVRVRSTDTAGGSIEQSFAIPLIADADADGLDDAWELRYFTTLAAATGTGNSDSDALTNLEEQAADTDPTIADTDGDTLSDSDEVIVYTTNPLVEDSDGDGLRDDIELSQANGFITSPTSADTDGDNYPDAIEIAEGTDPTSSASRPSGLIPLRISEILARNETGIKDGFGDRSDWIEIFNPNPSAVNLDSYYLTDEPTDLVKWNFPNVSIPAGGYLLVWASGQDTVDPEGRVHTNFSLSGSGEYLSLVRPDGLTIDSQFTPAFPEQFNDISYGIPSSGGLPAYFAAPTPGAINASATFTGVVKDTNFSLNRGFYTTAFPLSITTATPGAIIRYTLDGSEPSLTNGFIYNGPINISTTSTVRAIATRPGWLPTNVDTQTYIFTAAVAQQGATLPGWPSDWGFDSEVNGIVPSDYAMDPRVVNNTNGLGIYTIDEALRDIPTMAISLPQDSLTGGVDGMLTNPKGRFERTCSVEYILPDGSTGFQEDCKIETQGNSSRRPFRMQKHSMRLTFSSEVGIPKLRYNLFPDSDVDTFNKLVLRACFTDSWALASWDPVRYRPNDSQYTRDVWMKESMTDLGHDSGHGNFVHVYYNGVYFGVHNLTERIEDDWYAEHLGGETEDWQVNADFSTPPARWNELISIVNGNITSPSVYALVGDYLDLENFADYMLLHFYADAEDWPAKNGYAAANTASGDGKFRFQVWDQEIALDKYSWDRYDENTGPGRVFQRLRLNADFRALFADRVYRHMFNDGALSEAQSKARFLRLSNLIDKAIVAESARWGDVQANTPYGSIPDSSTDIDDDAYPPLLNFPTYFTREQHWITERDNILNNYIPTLHDLSDSRSIINELRAENLYPGIDPPTYSQRGGILAVGAPITLSAPAGTIYYTTDGSDPRSAGGGISANASSLSSSTVTDELIAFSSAGWRYLDNGIAQSDSNVTPGHPSYDSSDWKHPAFSPTGWKSGSTPIGYGTVGSIAFNSLVVPLNPRQTVYFRRDFTVTDATSYSELLLDIVRDDGAIIYLNGREIARTNMTAGVKTFSSLAINATPEGEVVSLPSFSLPTGYLVEGQNTIAIEVHQQGPSSSDLALDFRLRGNRSSSGMNTVSLTATSSLKARTLVGGEWSALEEAQFIVGTTATAGSLVISEIFYNPPGSSEATEWIELMNLSSSTIDLTDVSFQGISYQFAPGTLLAAGQRIVIVADASAFAAVYGTNGLLIAPGNFTGSLRNSGEELALLDATGADIVRFSYDDGHPWPTSPDGGGTSLTLVAPATNPDPTLAASWRPSVGTGGTPSFTDATTFSEVATADSDGDGMPALLEYAFGSSDALAASRNDISFAQVSHDGGLTQNLTITYERNLAADDLIFTVQTSTDMVGWTSNETAFVAAMPSALGRETRVYRSTRAVSSQQREFIRVRVQQR